MKRWLKRFALTLALGLLLATLGIVWDWYSTRRAGQKKLDAVIAKLNAEDPGWRLHELSDARNAMLPPNEKNGAVVVANVIKALPANYKRDEFSKIVWPDDEPNYLPDAETLARFDELLTTSGSALDQLGPLNGVPAGGTRLTLLPDPLAIQIPGVAYVGEVGALLQARVIVATSLGNTAEAVKDCERIVSVGRTIGDEYFLISQVARIAATLRAVTETERVIAMSERQPGLETLQRLLAQELTVPRLEFGFRGERGALYTVFANVDRWTYSEVNDLAKGMFRYKMADNWLEFQELRSYIPDQQASLLACYTDIIAAVRLFGPARRKAIANAMSQLPDFSKSRYRCIAFFFANVEQILGAEDRLIAQLGCAVAGIACERYRQKNGNWPKSLSDIPKDILAEIPTDPFTGKPVLFKRTTTGAVVYSTGSEGTDNGGENLDAKMTPGTDIGFRLYDPSHRRLPAKPKPPADGEEPK